MLEDAALRSHDLTLVRRVELRREIVWRLWTESRHLARWWGPHGFTNPQCSIEPRVGGRLRILMRSPDGEEFLNVGRIEVAEPPQRLVFTIALLDGDGGRRLENLTTVELADLGAATAVTVRVRVLHATPDARDNLAGMRDGWSESLTRLAQVKHEGEER